jgi:competence ComEA-like helix-hairpin-helix protein
LALTTAVTGQQARDATNPQGKWEVLDGCTLATNSVVDGDSFQVQHKDRTYIFRLYFVDAPEADASLQERIQDQAAYFGISTTDIPRGGRLAAQFTREKLTGREFTVVTRWQNAMGRSKMARFYGIVRVDGKNLAEELVSNGLARIYGLRASWPDGTRSTTVINKLKNLELAAREQRRGVWNEKAFARDTSAGAEAVATKSGQGGAEPVDINEASFEELQTLPGIGPKLAERIIAKRPYPKVDDLLKVQGIGPKTFERIRTMVRVESAEEK